jgi:hypothetical protein
VDDRLRRRLTRLLVVLMLITALWGAWVMAKNGGRRGRIGIPKETQKSSQTIYIQQFVKLYSGFNGCVTRGIAV